MILTEWEVFRVPNGFRYGDMELVDVHVLCMTHYLPRCVKRTETPGTKTAEWFATWMYFLTIDNPPNLQIMSRKLEYIL
jgi:hypothetical protein